MDLFNQYEDSKAYNGFAKLSIGHHEVKKFRLVRNKWFNLEVEGSLQRILLAELENEIVFLPSYMAVKFNNDDDKVEALNNDGVKRFLYFGGRRANK